MLVYNGTLARDGRLLNGVSSLLDRLSVFLHVHILTADTFGSVRKTFAESRHTVSVPAAGYGTPPNRKSSGSRVLIPDMDKI